MSSVVDLGHNLGMTLVAEGVETANALNALSRFGCDVAQGYHLSRPIPVTAFNTWCADRPITPADSPQASVGDDTPGQAAWGAA